MTTPTNHNDEELIARALKAYLDEQLKVDATSADTNHESLLKAKYRIGEQIEVHYKALELIEHEGSVYKKNLKELAMHFSQSEIEGHIVTKGHVLKAKEALSKHRSRYSFFDGYLTVGGLLLGVSIPQCIMAIEGKIPIDIYIISFGGLGMLLLGMGLIGKAKA